MMKSQVFSIFAWVGIGTSVVGMGCSDSPTVPPQTTTAASSSSNGSSGMSSSTGGEGGSAGGTGANGGNGGMTGVGGMGGSGGSGGAGGLGTVPIIDVPDTPCNPLVGATPVTLYADNSNAPALSSLSVVNGRRMAGGRFVPGFVTFDLSGASPSAAVVGVDPDFDRVASEGNTIGLVASDGTSIRFQRYSSNDTAVGPTLTLGNGSGAGLTIAGDAAGGSLVVWANASSLTGQFVDAAGSAQTPFTFADGIAVKSIATSMVRARTEFALAWSAVDNGIARGRFVRLSTSGIVGSIVELTGDSFKHYVVKLVKTPTGYALLLHSGALAFDTLVVTLDAQGNVAGSARRFVGTKFAMDLAAFGDSLGLVAKRADGVTEFRPLDAQGDPMGDWKCIDLPSTDTYDQAGIDADGAGWAIVYRTPGGGEKFVQTNLTGTATP